MNLPTFIVLLIVAVLVILDIRYLYRQGPDSCSGNCGSCGPSCKWVNDVEKARKSIARKKRIRAILHMQSDTK